MSGPALAIRSDDSPLLAMIQSFRLQLAADDKSEKTAEVYVESARAFARFVADRGLPTSLRSIRKDHINAFSAYLKDEATFRGKRLKPATRHIRLRSLRSFFKWALAEGEIDRTPFEGMTLKPPKEEPLDFPDAAKLKKLLATLDDGKGFDERRDAALIRMMADTGARRHEIASLRYVPASEPGKEEIDEVNDVRGDRRLVRVLGKGGYVRDLPLGAKASRALDRYLRIRPAHPYADVTTNLWLCRKGKLTDHGIGQMLRRRALAAGLKAINPHQLRHFFIDDALAHGMSEGDVMRLTGHKTRKMLDRYAAKNQVARAILAHRANSPGDRL